MEQYTPILPKCKPKTPNVWTFTNEDFVLDGAPALLVESKVTCSRGGVISIVIPEVECGEEIQEIQETEPISESEIIEEQENVVEKGVDNARNNAIEKLLKTQNMEN